MKKCHNNLRILCALLLCMILVPAFVSCGQLIRGEEITVYPCYYNQDVDGVDGQCICRVLDREGWVREEPENPESSKPMYENSTAYLYHTGEENPNDRKGIVIYEFESAEQAEAVYVDNLASCVFAGSLPLDHVMFQTELRISNCLIMTIRNAHVDLLAMLDLGEMRPLQVYENTTHQSMRKPGSVDINALRTKMEADGYRLYSSTMYGEDQEEEYSNTYVMISPTQDRAYAFTQGKELKWGLSNTYFATKLLNETDTILVGIHVVDFKDGSSIICYGDSFEEIREYFEE